MLEMARNPKNEFLHDPKYLVDYCRFAERLRHFESGNWELNQTDSEGNADPSIVLEPFEIWIEDAIHGFRLRHNGTRLVKTALELIPRKNAKAVALDTPIPTPTGWTTMGQIRVGDLVIGADGKPALVSAESEVFTDHDCYKVTFSNGQEIVADAGHRWLTTARVDLAGIGAGKARVKSKKGETLTKRVRTTKEIFDTQAYGRRGDRNHSITMPAPQTGEYVRLPIDPYLLGAWLGDGDTNNTSVTCGDQDIVEMTRLLSGLGVDISTKRDPKAWRIRLHPLMHDFGMFGCHKGLQSGKKRSAKDLFRMAGVLGSKHIPAAYLRASFEQRLALLQGLMDTDGTINKTGREMSFVTILPALRDGFGELLSTLGIKFSVTEKKSVCNGVVTGGTHYRFQFHVTRDRLPVFRIARKLDRMRTKSGGGERSRTVQVTKVERVASVPVKCITVENEDHLFLVGKTMLPTHNSLRATRAALFELCCSGGMAPEIPIAAFSSKQADDTLYGDIVKMLNNDEELREQFKIRVTQEEITSNGGRIFKLTQHGERIDGLNPSLALFEEGHAGAALVYKVVDSAFGARPNALRRMITTAGHYSEGPAFDLLSQAQMILEGKVQDFTFFAAIYTLDREDFTNNETNAIDWERLLTDESLIEKCNPMYRVGLDPSVIRAAVNEALRLRPDKRGEVARTRFNIWTGAGMTLIEASAWGQCKRAVSLSDYFGMKCWIGVDLAQVLDMCAITLLFELPAGQLVAFAKFFLPAESPTARNPDLVDHLAIWEEQGHLVLTPGPLADHDLVRADVEAFCDVFDVQVIACDPAQAHNTVKYLWDGNRPVVVYPNSAKTMTAPTDDILGRIAAQTIWHDGNPVLAWNAQNVHGERKANGSIIPRKEKENSPRKIDGFVALCFANGCRMQPDEAKPAGEVAGTSTDPYLKRGILGFEQMVTGDV